MVVLWIIDGLVLLIYRNRARYDAIVKSPYQMSTTLRSFIPLVLLSDLSSLSASTQAPWCRISDGSGPGSVGLGNSDAYR